MQVKSDHLINMSVSYIVLVLYENIFLAPLDSQEIVLKVTN